MAFSDRTCLVTLELKSPGFRKTTKTGSAKLANDYHADNDRVAASVALLPREAIAPITKIHADVRKLVEGKTAAWSGKSRVMLITGIQDLKTEFEKYLDRHEKLVEKFLDQYDATVRASKKAIGNFAGEFEFPSRAKVQSKLSMCLNFTPLPGANVDWRLAVAQEEIEILKAGIEAAQRESAQENRQRATDALLQMVERVEAYRVVSDASGDKVQGAFHQSTLDNLRDTARILRDLNFVSDETFFEVCDTMERLGDQSAKELKDAESLREHTLKTARDAIAKLNADN